MSMRITPRGPAGRRTLPAPPGILRRETTGGLLLIAAAALALLVANSPAAAAYRAVLSAPAGPLSVQHWIDDGLMAIFFLLVGLEIKRECVTGALADPRARRLPVVAALAGMVVPALVYLAIAGGTQGLVRGWAIPAATDIAFAVGVLALAGRRVPPSLRLFLATVAIVDDMGAVAIIAIGYTGAIDPRAIGAAAVILLLMAVLNRRGERRLWPYLSLAAALWLTVLLSGVHATVAGVLAAMAIPARAGPGAAPLDRLEHALRPWAACAIVPLFGFANAGVALGGIGWRAVFAPLPLGIAAGLFAGKQIGIFGAVRIAVALGFAARPRGAGWWQVYGVALLCGIGFTMSLFIGGLAFADSLALAQVRIGVLGGSIAAAAAGALVLRLAPGPIDPFQAAPRPMLV